MLKNNLKSVFFLGITSLSIHILSMPTDSKKFTNVNATHINSFIKQNSALTATAFAGMLGLGYYYWWQRTPCTTNQTTQVNGSAKQRLKNIWLTISSWVNPVYMYFISQNKPKTKVDEKKDSTQSIISGIGPSNEPVLENLTSSNLSFDQLVKNSNNFNDQICKFPTTNNRIAIIAKDDTAKQRAIEKQAQETRPIMHKKVITLIEKFLAYKKEFGSNVEKVLYSDMNRDAFINRLLSKRPLMFMGPTDMYLLRNGQQENIGKFEIIGTDQERIPFILKEYLSYDEMAIAALIGVSTPTYFINNGSRNNSALPGIEGSYQETGFYVGLVGARFEKDHVMESQHMLIFNDKNSPSALLKLWEEFYGEKILTFTQAEADTTKRYLKIEKSPYFADTRYLDTVIYKKPLKMVIEPFLVDANQRGQESGKKSYCHVVGLGLGVWRVSDAQTQLMVDTYADILKEKEFPHISDIDFSYFAENIHIKDSNFSRNNHITIHFSKRNPADKLIGPHADKLLVAMYAWYGNAYPGNEYWSGFLTASGDPAAACCSTIPELQNPLINTGLTSQRLLLTE